MQYEHTHTLTHTHTCNTHVLTYWYLPTGAIYRGIEKASQSSAIEAQVKGKMSRSKNYRFEPFQNKMLLLCCISIIILKSSPMANFDSCTEVAIFGGKKKVSLCTEVAIFGVKKKVSLIF